MAVLLSDVITELSNKGYPPRLLTNATVQTACDTGIREMQAHVTMRNFSTFPVVIDQQNYYIFDPAKPEYCAPSALHVAAIYWNPSGDFSSPDIFSPGFQLFTTIVAFGQNTFDQPSDMIVLRQKLDAWSQQFGQQGFDIYGQPGDPAAFIQISPTPTTDDSTVLVEWDSPYTLANVLSLTTGWGRYLMQWVEYRMAENAARYYSVTAGTEVGGWKDSGKTLQFWQGEVARLKKIAETSQGGVYQGIVGRT